MWDAKARQTYADDQPYTPSRLAFTVAMQMVYDDAKSRVGDDAESRDSATGLTGAR